MDGLGIFTDTSIVLIAAITGFASVAANLPLIVACRRHGVRNPGGFPLRLLLGQTPSQFLYLGLLFPVAVLAATCAAVRFLQADFPIPTIETRILDNFWVIFAIGIPVSLYVVYSDSLDTTPDFFLLRRDLAEKSSVAAECVYDAIERGSSPAVLTEIRKIPSLKDFSPPSERGADVVPMAIAHLAEEFKRKDSNGDHGAPTWIDEFDQRAPELHKSILFLQSLFSSLLQNKKENGSHAFVDSKMALADKTELGVVVFFVWNYLILFGLLGLVKSNTDGNADHIPVEASLFLLAATLFFWYVPLRYYTRKGMALLSGNRARDFGGTGWAALLGAIVLIVIVVWVDPDVGNVIFKLLPAILAAGGLLLTHFRFGVARILIGTQVSVRKFGMLLIIYSVVLFFAATAWFG